MNKSINKYELAEKLGISFQAVYLWFQGKTKPSYQNLIKMSEELKIPIDEVVKMLDKK